MAEVGSKEEYEAQIKALKLLYIHSLPGKKRAINTSWQRLNQGQFDRTEGEKLIRSVHQLVGSGGSYGFSGITDAAKAIETLLTGVLADGRISPGTCAGFDMLFERLGQAFSEATDSKTGLPK